MLYFFIIFGAISLGIYYRFVFLKIENRERSIEGEIINKIYNTKDLSSEAGVHFEFQLVFDIKTDKETIRLYSPLSTEKENLENDNLTMGDHVSVLLTEEFRKDFRDWHFYNLITFKLSKKTK